MREKPTGYDSMSILLQKIRIAMGLTATDVLSGESR